MKGSENIFVRDIPTFIHERDAFIGLAACFLGRIELLEGPTCFVVRRRQARVLLKERGHQIVISELMVVIVVIRLSFKAQQLIELPGSRQQ